MGLALVAGLSLCTACVPILQAPGPSSKEAQSSLGSTDPRSTKPKQSKTSVKLFDDIDGEYAFNVNAGPIWFNEARGSLQNSQLGFGEVRISQSHLTPHKVFTLTGQQELAVRVFDEKAFSVSAPLQTLSSGVRWKGLVAEAHIGFSLLNVDNMYGNWSAQMLSPRVGGAVGFKVERIRLDLGAHSEYLWRWFGRDYVVSGLTLGFRLDIPRAENTLELPTTKSSQ